MSSFIVQDRTINRFINFVYWLKSSDLNKDFILRKLKGVGLSVENDAFCQEFGFALMSLNCMAVASRYDENLNQKAIDGFKFGNIEVTEIQALKSLQCLLYQCCEGSVPKTKLYKVLREIETSIMHSIINKMPEYEKAGWDAE